MADQRIGTAIRLPVDLVARLDVVCEERVVGRNLIVTKAIEQYLDRLPPLDTDAYERGWQDAMHQEHPPEASPNSSRRYEGAE